jgi:hypothetical protein
MMRHTPSGSGQISLVEGKVRTLPGTCGIEERKTEKLKTEKRGQLKERDYETKTFQRKDERTKGVQRGTHSRTCD